MFICLFRIGRRLLFGAHREAGLHGVQVVEVPDLYGVVDGADHAWGDSRARADTWARMLSSGH